MHTPLAPKREIASWAMFDFANQAYTLLIITVIFGDLFTRIIVGDAPDYRLGNLLWSCALAISYLMVVLVNPLCGALMDSGGYRKRFLFFSYILTVSTTILLYWVEPGMIWLAMLLIIVSNFAYAIGESFIASFLPSLGPRKALGWISGLGWSVGYLGGMLATAFTLFFLGEVSADNYDTIRWVGPFAGIFFLLAAIPTFIWLKEPPTQKRTQLSSSFINSGYQRILTTWQELHHFQDLKQLMFSIFFSMAGISIIISFSFIYGAQVIGWDDKTRTLMFITVQITAALGAFTFGFLQSRLGAKRIYISTLTLWLVTIITIWQTPRLTLWLNDGFALALDAQQVFLLAGVLSGLSLGSAQSAGRALVGVMTPLSKSAEFFGFWGTAAKLAAVTGLIGLGLIQWLLGLANAILLCLILFALAIITVIKVDEKRGEAAADNWIDKTT